MGGFLRPTATPQPCIPEMIGRAPGEMIKGGGGKGGNASLPGDNRVSRRIRYPKPKEASITPYKRLPTQAPSI
eukprot:scaffold1054_cov116-Isochrysis_galbana.AAC.23